MVQGKDTGNGTCNSVLAGQRSPRVSSPLFYCDLPSTGLQPAADPRWSQWLPSFNTAWALPSLHSWLCVVLTGLCHSYKSLGTKELSTFVLLTRICCKMGFPGAHVIIQSPQGVLLAQGARVQLKHKLCLPKGYWQMVWEVRQRGTCCGWVPLARSACFALPAGSKTPLGGGEPIHAVQSADPWPAHPISSKATGTGESWAYDPGQAQDLFEICFLRKDFLPGH